MTSILFERRPNVYLPEISAYMRYLENNHPEVKFYDSLTLEYVDPRTYDVVWRFMGADVMGKGDYIVHDYNSLSATPFPRLKNRIKKLINQKPAKRVFLNKQVEADFGFADKVPSHIRNMGIGEAFYYQEPNPEFDFVYCGSVDRGAEVDRLLQYLVSEGRDLRILVVGSISRTTRRRYAPHTNITFTGRVLYEDVPKHMARGRWGLNLIPNCYPFNLQTATKVLEYCAVGLPIVTMRYPWIEDFEQERKAKFFYLEPDFSNLTFKNLEEHTFKVPSVDDLRWASVIHGSRVFDFLK